MLVFREDIPFGALVLALADTRVVISAVDTRAMVQDKMFCDATVVLC